MKIVEPKKDNDIEIMTKHLKKIFEFLKTKDYKFIKLEEIFYDLKNWYLNKSLDEFCKFNTFVDFLRSQNVKEKIL